MSADPKPLTWAELAARRADLDRREAALKARAAQARSQAIADFLLGLFRRGRLPANEIRRVASFMEALPESAQVIEFAGGPWPVNHGSAIDVFKSFLQGLPPRRI